MKTTRSLKMTNWNKIQNKFQTSWMRNTDKFIMSKNRECKKKLMRESSSLSKCKKKTFKEKIIFTAKRSNFWKYKKKILWKKSFKEKLRETQMISETIISYQIYSSRNSISPIYMERKMIKFLTSLKTSFWEMWKTKHSNNKRQ